MSIKTGMLWLDTSDRTLEEKVRVAAAHYKAKYGQAPTECQVHQGLPHSVVVDGIRVIPSRGILPGHFFIGMSNLPPAPAKIVSVGDLQYTRDELLELIEKAQYMAGVSESGGWAEEMLPKYQAALQEYEEKYGLPSAS